MWEDRTPRTVALGNGVWLDEIRNEGVAPIKDVPGGSVTFSTLGARLFTAAEPTRIGMIFNAGGDFPEAILELFRSWSITLSVHHRSDEPSSRGLVFYEKANGNRKGFQRLTPPMPVEIKDLQGTEMLHSASFTFFGTAAYIEEQTVDMKRLRWRSERYADDAINPFVVWEPHAKSCRPDTLDAHLRACRSVGVFSPNHEELASFFCEPSAASFDRSIVERQARTFIDSGIGSSDDGCMLVRAANHGCLILSRQHEVVWLPSYYDSDSHMVVDPTGAGNAFLGAFVIGLQETGSCVEAAKYGQVAASFVIEQIGLPALTGDGDGELWNSCSVRERLAEYRTRVRG